MFLTLRHEHTDGGEVGMDSWFSGGVEYGNYHSIAVDAELTAKVGIPQLHPSRRASIAGLGRGSNLGAGGDMCLFLSRRIRLRP